MLALHCHKPASMPVLLRLLLIILLLLNSTASAWAASVMAVSLVPAADAPLHPVAAAAETAASDCHGQPAADQDPMPCGNDSRHCDCLHYSSALPGSASVLLASIPRAGPHSLPAASTPPPHLADPVRPPIARHA